MKKITFATILLIGTLGMSALGQAKSEVTVNNPAKAADGVIEPVGGVPALVRNSDNNQEETANALHSGFTSTSRREIHKAPLRLMPLKGNDVLAETTRESPLLSTNTSSTSNSEAPTVASTVATVNPTEIYRVGIGDVLDVHLTQSPGDRSTLFTVLAGGVLDYPLIRNPIPVAGLTTADIAARLRQEIKIFDKPDFVVAVRDYASHNVTVNGLVTAPGIKRLRREAVPLYVVISQSLPLVEAARAKIVRTGVPAITVDLSDAKASSILVIPGDVIRVSGIPPGPTEFFFVGGEVTAPGQKPYHAGLTLTQAILASGGLTKIAGTEVRISRQTMNGRLVTTEYNLGKIHTGEAPDPVLQKDDRLEINPR